jgi:ABC-2 type transport system permease protein
MRLLLVELTRFRSRRAIALMLLAAALLAAILATTTIWETRPVSAQDQANAQAQAEAEAQQPYMQRELRRCLKKPGRYMGPGATAADCEANILPQPEWYLYRSTLSLAEESDDSGLAVIMLVSGIMIIVGATFAGGDWSSGSMSNQLIFEPRRIRVWLAKAGALFLGSLLAAVVIMAGFWVALYVAAEMRDISTGATVQEHIRAIAGRGTLMAAFGALGGYALSMLLRHTVGTLALLFAYAVGGEALTASLPIAGAGRWSLGNNVFAWLRNGYSYWDDSLPCARGGFDCDKNVLMTMGEGTAYLGGVLLFVVVLSVVFFRRRDIP